MTLRRILLAAAITALPAVALAQSSPSPSHGGHSGHPAPGLIAETRNAPSTEEYRRANETMHRNMDIAFTGNSDVDFVRGMIPHHQGAIDMAKVALRHTKDEQIRKWATDVIREQEREIAEMQAWLRKNGAQ